MKIGPVELTSRWFEILGNKRSDMPDSLRRQRWNEWKDIAIKSSKQEAVEFWTDNSACSKCRFIDNDWCKLQQLPCTVNPILTFSEGLIGMACMGASLESIKDTTQLSLW